MARLFKEARKQAQAYAADFTIQHAGVTKDGSIVTTLACVEYQISVNNLYVWYDGNWHFERKGNSSGWLKGKIIATYH